MLKIILAGILALPSFLVCIVVAPIVALLSIPSLLLLLFRKGDNSDKYPDNVIIAGGSSGIGLCIAKQLCSCRDKKKQVKRIILLARNKEKLEKAKKELEAILLGLPDNAKIANETTKITSSIKVEIFSVSVSNYEDLCVVAKNLNLDVAKENEKTVLFNCAGIPYTTEFDKVPIEYYLKLIQTNQLGAMYLTKAFLPFIQNGVIVFTSSAAAQVGVYGYSIYSPTKYALRGFAETLHNELIYTKPNVHVQIAFPADTDTPGYAEEAKMMPQITQKLNESAGLANPEDTAKEMIRCAFASNPKFAVYFNLEGWLLTNLTAGMSPVTNMSDAITQVTLSGLLRFVSLFYLNDFWRIINQFRLEDKNKNTNKED